jgi:hypothetical protein
MCLRLASSCLFAAETLPCNVAFFPMLQHISGLPRTMSAMACGLLLLTAAAAGKQSRRSQGDVLVSVLLLAM